MDLKQIESIIVLAEEKNISRAAEKLAISQSALSQKLKKLEDELGAQLFVRGKRHLTLTPAGELYVQNSLRIIDIKNQTYKHIAELSNYLTGQIAVGVAPGLSPSVIATVYPEFHERYPGYTIRTAEQPFYKIEELLLQGRLDIGFFAFTDMETNHSNKFNTAPLRRSDIHVAVSHTNPIAIEHNAKKGDLITGADIREFRYLPFALPPKTAKLRTIADDVFANAGITPTVLYEVVESRPIYTMIANSNMATFIPEDYIPREEWEVHFKLQTNRYWDLTMCWLKGHEPTAAEDYFIQLCREYFE